MSIDITDIFCAFEGSLSPSLSLSLSLSLSQTVDVNIYLKLFFQWCF